MERTTEAEESAAPTGITAIDLTGSACTSPVNSSVPSDEVVATPSLQEEPYYHGLLPREDLEPLLVNNGDFLVRISQPRADEPQRQIVISMMANNQVDTNVGIRHIVVRRQIGKYQVEGSPRFDSVRELIDYFHREQRALVPSVDSSILIRPIPRQRWELRNQEIDLIKKLGEGQFGEVHKGVLRRKKRNVKVAVKVAKNTAGSKEKIKEMMAEARIMRHYNHPNVVKLYGVCLDLDPIMIVMELVRGGSLDIYLQKNAGQIPDSEKLNSMCSGTAWGLEYLHSKKCIHRDIAARNCLYDKHKAIKISDFGLSREGEQYKMKVTRKVPVKWIAPETLVNFTYTRASDCYSFGVLCWEVATDGADPFEGKKTAEIKEFLLRGERLEFPSKASAELKDLVLNCCWNAKPEDRLSLTQICQKLEQITGVKQPPRMKNQRTRQNRASAASPAANPETEDLDCSRKSNKSQCSRERTNDSKTNTGDDDDYDWKSTAPSSPSGDVLPKKNASIAKKRSTRRQTQPKNLPRAKQRSSAPLTKM